MTGACVCSPENWPPPMAATLVAALGVCAWRRRTVSAGLCFVLDYAYPGRWLTSPNLIRLAVALLVTAALIMTNDLPQRSDPVSP